MKLFLDLKDKRIIYLKKWLEDRNYFTKEFKQSNFKSIKKGDVCLLSPAFKFSTELADSLPEKINILCGNVSEEVSTLFLQKKIFHYSFLNNEIFVLKNATLTAEGMLADFISNTNRSIFDQKILILGSGRVAKAVGILFNRLGLSFDLATRNKTEFQTAHLIANKCFLGREFVNRLFEYDVVINTIPTKYFEQKEIKKFKKDCVVFELASKQCLEGLEIKEFKYVLCPALPSVYSPISAGDLLKEKLEEFLQKGVIND